jgi:hypothetical protein
VRALAAGEDSHGFGPALQLVAVRAFAQQAGQLGDVRFFDPARAVRAAPVRAGAVGAALADLAPAVDGVGDLVAVPGGEPVQLLDQGVAGAGPSQVIISVRRSADGSAAIASSSRRSDRRRCCSRPSRDAVSRPAARPRYRRPR